MRHQPKHVARADITAVKRARWWWLLAAAGFVAANAAIDWAAALNSTWAAGVDITTAGGALACVLRLQHQRGFVDGWEAADSYAAEQRDAWFIDDDGGHHGHR